MHPGKTTPRRLLQPLAAALLILGFAAPNLTGKPLSERLMVGGVERHYLLDLPGTPLALGPLPVVFVFHPKNTDAALIEGSLPFPRLAAEQHFIAVFPDGLDRQWNGGRRAPASRDAASSDDVEFVRSILQTLRQRYPVDPRRIFATGISNGAIFCYTLAARLADQIAAIGPVAGALGNSIPGRFTPSQPVSVIAFNGTDDTFVPFKGYDGPDGGLLSVSSSISFWVRADGCATKPEATQLPPHVPDDGTSVVRFSFPNPTRRAAVVSYVIVHGGHTWPGQPADPAGPKGRSTLTVDATTEILRFFFLHPKPGAPGPADPGRTTG